MNDRTQTPKQSNPIRPDTRTRACGFIIVAAVALSSCGCQQLPPEAVQQLDQARTALDARQYAACERLLDPIISRYNKQSQTATALYMRAQCRMKTDRRRQARKDLTTAMPLAKDGLLRAFIDVQLGNLAFDDGAYSQASMHYGDALDKLPDGPPADRVLYQRGLALQRTNHFNEARKLFEQVYTKYPTSPHALSARKKHAWDGDFFTVQCGAFRQIDRAHKAAARLRQDGVNALAIPDLREGGRRYVVRVGRYRTYADASRQLDRVRLHQPDAFIVP